MKLITTTTVAAVGAAVLFGAAGLTVSPSAHADHTCTLGLISVPHPDFVPCAPGAIDSGPLPDHLCTFGGVGHLHPAFLPCMPLAVDHGPWDGPIY